jgi:WD40 repeat protein
METSEKYPAKQIVRAASHALVARSAGIVARGLRDLVRDSSWFSKKIFSGHSSRGAISPAGQVCALSPVAGLGTERLAIYDMELSVSPLALTLPEDSGTGAPGNPAAFAWSPTARHLAAAWGGWLPKVHVFDLHRKAPCAAFADYSNFPASLNWSNGGNYFAAASLGETAARLRLWESAKTANGEPAFPAKPKAELGAAECSRWPEWQEGEAIDQAAPADEPVDGDAVAGFSRAAFSPDEDTLATVIEIEGEWADDSIALLEVPTLRKQSVFHAQGHVTDLAWTCTSGELIFCSAGQASRLSTETMEPVPLPFGAELCACHPHLPLCLCFSSWLKNSAKGRLFLADLTSLKVFDECAAEGVVDLRWSLDGSKAYAISSDGLAYVYEPALF